MAFLRRLVGVALASVLFVAGACGDGAGDQEELADDRAGTEGASHVAVSLTDAGCDPREIEIVAGKIAFDVTNDNAQNVSEFAVLRPNDSELGEVVDVARGTTKTLTLTLDEGDYVTKCRGARQENGTLRVTSADSGEDGTTTTAETTPTTSGGDADQDPGADTGH